MIKKGTLFLCFVRNIEMDVLFLCIIYKNKKFIKVYHLQIRVNNDKYK